MTPLPLVVVSVAESDVVPPELFVPLPSRDRGIRLALWADRCKTALSRSDCRRTVEGNRSSSHAGRRMKLEFAARYSCLLEKALVLHRNPPRPHKAAAPLPR